MRGKVENTIPQRQYENIRVTYYFENDQEREDAIQQSIEDCVVYKHTVQELLEKKMAYYTEINGISWRKQDGVWSYKDKEGSWK